MKKKRVAITGVRMISDIFTDQKNPKFHTELIFDTDFLEVVKTFPNGFENPEYILCNADREPLFVVKPL